MNRRDALKIAAVAALGTSVANAYDTKLLYNKNDMKIMDPAKPTKAELKHLPEIKIGAKDAKGYSLIEVNIGQAGIIHPSDPTHWIYEIELFANKKSVSTVSLEPVISRGFLATRVKLDEVQILTAVSKCNLHGNYTASIKV